MNRAKMAASLCVRLALSLGALSVGAAQGVADEPEWMSTFHIKAAYHDTIASSQGNWETWVDSKLSDMTLQLGLANPVPKCPDDPDVNGCVLFNRPDPVGIFTGEGYQVVDSKDVLDKVLGMTAWHYKIVAQILVGFGEYGENGVASPTSRSVIVTMMTDADTWSHEFGHTQGITTHRDDDICTDVVMNTSQYQDDIRDVINEAERTKFMLNPDAQDFACNGSTPPGLRYLVAFSEGGAITIKFRTEVEYQMEGFKLYRAVAQPDSAVLVATVAPAGGDVSVEYSVVDGLGAVGDRYSLYAARTGRSDIPITSCEATAAGNVVLWEPGWTNPDSLVDVLTGGEPIIEALPDPCHTGIPSYAIIGPDSFSTALTLYANIWHDRGVNAKFVALSYVDSCSGGIQEYLDFASARGLVAALLVGDASDSVLWDSPSAWSHPGWTYPTEQDCGGTNHPPGDTGKNILPTCYYPYTKGPQFYSMTSWTPYYATDLPYADVGGDGLPDIAIGRLPAATKAEVINYAAKLSNYLQATGNTIPRTCYQIGRAVDALPAVAGHEAEWYLDDIAGCVPANVALSRYYVRGDERYPEVVKTGALAGVANGRDAANLAANSGAGIIVWQTTAADRYQWIPSWNLFLGWSVEDLAVPPQPFIGLGLSCGMANYDMTEFQDWRCAWGRIRPLAERLLVHPQKGAIVFVGPTRGSFQRGTMLFGREFIPRVFEDGLNVGTAFNHALRSCLVKHPAFTDQFREFVVLGDPLIGATTLDLTGVPVDPNSTPRAMRFASVRPNPFNGHVTAAVAPGPHRRVGISVFDVAGRLVRDLGTLDVTGGRDVQVSWDGIHASGRPAGSGIYFVVARAGVDKRSARVVLMR